MNSVKASVHFPNARKYLLPAFTIFGLFTGAVWAQVTASITGTVRDTSGAIVPGAAVTVKHVETGATRAVETDASGNYSAASLPVGQYEVSVEKSGFKQQIRRGITLVVGQQAVVNLTLEIGDVQQQVMVMAEAPLVNTTTSSTSGLVGEKEVKELPLNGRSFDQLLTLNVGTANYSSNRAATQPGNLFSVAGRRPEENRFLMNGVDYVGASAETNTSTPNGASGEVLGVDAVREFNVVQHTYGAEYGKRAGGQISIVTSSGTNQLHGGAFEYLRNSVLDARNFFDYPLGLRIPPFKRNQFGGSLGGTVKKDKLFLFGNYEGFRQRLGISDVAIVPDANARQGLLPNAQGIPTPVTGLKPGMLPFANNFWPAPNGPVLGAGLALDFANPIQKVREDFGLVRWDYNASAKDSLSANYLIQDGENNRPSADPNFVTLLPPRSQLISFQETHIFSSSLLSVATIGFARAHISAETIPAVPIPESLSFVSGVPPGTLTIGGSSSGAGQGTITNANGSSGPTTYSRNFFTWADDVHYVKGNHTWSTGFWIQRVQSNRNGSGAAKSTVSYPTLVAFLTDSPSTFQAVPAPSTLGYRSTEAAWYVQDEIKLKPNFTLRLGLRDEMTTGWNETTGRCANYVFDQNGVLKTDPVVGESCLQQNNAKSLWQPRVGLAWDPTGKGNWAVRAGFGIYNTLQDNVDQAFGANPPFNSRLSTSSPLLSIIPLKGGTQPLPSCSATQGQPCSTFQPGQLDPNLHTPTVQEWSFTVERQLRRDLMLQLGYVGSQAYHLEVNVDSNTVLPLVCSDAQGCVSGGVGTARGLVPQGATYLPPASRPNPFVARTFERLFEGTSSYHALNVSLLKRASGGLSFKANYTYSKVLDMNSALDTNSGVNQVSDAPSPHNLALSKGPAAFNLKHQFNTNVSYELPFGPGKHWGGGATGWRDKLIGGWQWNAILAVQPGFPFMPTVGSNRSGSGDTGNPDVPNRNPAFSGRVILGTANRWFDPNAFLLPTAGTFGNAGRDQFPGPGLTELDTSLFKRISLGERWNMQLRAEVFNILNHTNLGPPTLAVFAGTSVSPAAGVITTTATSSRQIQFALKLNF
jgi:carboxypeptidase family protein